VGAKARNTDSSALKEASVTNDDWRADCIIESIAPEGQIEREKTMAKKLKKSKKLQSTKSLSAKA
jgi:hypothetical protein